MRIKIFITVCVLAALVGAAPDPNFHIYLAFGQSNMEGQGDISQSDRVVEPRFKLMSTVSCANLNRTLGTWTDAVPPMFRCATKLALTDNFGRVMAQKMPSSVTIGVVPVAVAGAKIELFDKNNFQSYLNGAEQWVKSGSTEYGGNPYARLVEMAKEAQKSGVIKGILMHQGESNTGEPQWANKVKGVYNDLLADLGLKAADVPLIVGEVVDRAAGGICASHNSLINALPQTIPTAHVVSASGLRAISDNIHFNADAYRELGKRYAEKMAPLVKMDGSTPEPEPDPDPEVEPDPEPQTGISVWLEGECAQRGADWELHQDAGASNGQYVEVRAGLNAIEQAPGESGLLSFNFVLSEAGTYNVHARMNAATADDDSYWVKMNDGAYTMVNQLFTSGWEWKLLESYTLNAGNHTLTIGYREDGAKLDKIRISNLATEPSGMGDAVTCEVPVAVWPGAATAPALQVRVSAGILQVSLPTDASKAQFSLYNTRGKQVLTTALKSGNTQVQASHLPTGLYIYKVQIGKELFSKTISLTQLGN